MFISKPEVNVGQAFIFDNINKKKCDHRHQRRWTTATFAFRLRRSLAGDQLVLVEETRSDDSISPLCATEVRHEHAVLSSVPFNLVLFCKSGSLLSLRVMQGRHGVSVSRVVMSLEAYQDLANGMFIIDVHCERVRGWRHLGFHFRNPDCFVRQGYSCVHVLWLNS